MSFVWIDPSGSQHTISEADPIVRVMNALKAQHDRAAQSTRHGKQASLDALAALYTMQERQYVAFCKQRAEEIRGFVEQHLMQLLSQESWWEECLRDPQPAVGAPLSEIQKKLLGDELGQFMPSTWQEARKLLDCHHELRAPSVERQAEAEELLGAAMEAGAAALKAATTYKKAFDDGANWQALGPPLTEALHAFLAAKEQLDARAR